MITNPTNTRSSFNLIIQNIHHFVFTSNSYTQSLALFCLNFFPELCDGLLSFDIVKDFKEDLEYADRCTVSFDLLV